MHTTNEHLLPTGRRNFVAFVFLVVLAAVSITSVASADATITTHGQILEGATTLDQWTETDTAFLNAVAELAAQHDMSAATTTIRLVTEDPDRGVYGVADARTGCLVEVTTFAGISATCATVEEITERGLFIARFVPDPADPTAVITADVIAAAPGWTSAVAGVPDTANPIGISSGEILSIRYDSSQLELVDDLAWQKEDGTLVPAGVNLPSFDSIS